MNIDDMSIEELLELNQIICERIDYLRAREDSDVLRQLHIGHQVCFEGRYGTEFGIVIKINRKTVIVLTEDKRQWKVPAGKLSIIKDIQPDKGDDNNVLE